jgi:carbon storage regulator CsrA
MAKWQQGCAEHHFSLGTRTRYPWEPALEAGMLVLSRSEGDGITFPDLELKVQVLRITGNRVQVGIDADPKIRALRSELASSDLGESYSRTSKKAHSQMQAQSEIQNQINALQQTLDIAQQQLNRGEPKRAERTLEQFHLPGSVTKVSEPGPGYNIQKSSESAASGEQLAC